MKKQLDLIIIDNDLEAIAIRSALEWWGVRVNLHLIGKAQDFVDIFQKDKLAEYICIASHGNEIDGKCGFNLPELGGEIAKKQPYKNIITATDLSDFVKLQGNH